MDWLKSGVRMGEAWKKYRSVLLIIALGLTLMWIPEKQSQPNADEIQEPAQKNVQESLQEILSRIQGVGRVAVLVTEKKGEEVVYQTDEEIHSGDTSQSRQSSTVMTTDTERKETGLVRVVYPPVLQGAVIVCQGGNDPKVKLAVVEAVTRATGLPSTSIAVLKMK